MPILPADRTGARPPRQSKSDSLGITDAEAPFVCEGGFVVPNRRASRAAARKRIADGVLRVAGVFLVQFMARFWREAKHVRQGTGSRRGSLHPPRRQGAFRPLQPRPYAHPAHRPTLRAPRGTRVDCLRSRLPPRSASLRVVEALRIGGRGGKRFPRHRHGTFEPLHARDRLHPRLIARQGPPGTSGKLSAARKLVPKLPFFPP